MEKRKKDKKKHKHHEGEQHMTLWVSLDGFDPVPLQIDPAITAHDLKLLLQSNEDLELPEMRPNRMKLICKSEDGKPTPLPPQKHLGETANDGDTLFIEISNGKQPQKQYSDASITVTSLQSDSNSYSDPVLKIIKDLRAELDQLKSKLNENGSTPIPTDNLVLSQSSSITKETNKRNSSFSSDDSHALMSTLADLKTRLHSIEEKVDEKNQSFKGVQDKFEGAVKELRVLTASIRGLGGMSPLPDQIKEGKAFGANNIVDSLPAIKCKTTLEGHNGPVWAVAATEDHLFTGSSDTTVVAWDLTTLKPTHTLQGHKSIVHSIATWSNYVMSGSDDKTVKIWDMEQDYKCIKTLRTNNIACVLKVASGHLFAGSYKCVKVWNLESFEVTKSLEAYNHWVRALNITKGHLYSGSYNLINMWDIGTFKLLKNMTHTCGSVYSIVVYDHLMIAGTYENTINIWDLLPGHTGAVYSLAVNNGKLYSGSYDNTIRVWDLNAFQCVQKCVGHTSSVEALESVNDTIFSASSDSTVKMWK